MKEGLVYIWRRHGRLSQLNFSQRSFHFNSKFYLTNGAKIMTCRIQTKCWKCRPVTVSITDLYFATECLTWSLISRATTRSWVENGAQRLRWAAGLGCVVAACGKCAMREDGTSPICCGFSFHRGCCWTRSRRVQPEVRVERTDSQKGAWLLCRQSCVVQLWSDPAFCLTTGSFATLSWKQ